MLLREITEARDSRFRWDSDWARWHRKEGHYLQLGWIYPNGDWETADSYDEKTHELMARRISDQLGMGRSDVYQDQLLSARFVRWYRGKDYLTFRTNLKKPTVAQCESLLSMLDNTSVMAGVSRINVNTAGKLFQFSNADGLSAADSFRDQLERWITGKKPTKSVSEKMTSDQQLDEVTIDNRQGAGETPNHSNIDYLGLRVKMRPSVFLKLTPALAAGDSAAAMIDLIKQGGAIAAAQLYVDIPGDWDTGDLLDPATVRNHEGRHRMRAVLTVEGDDPVEVHILPQGLRRHHLTDAMIADMQQRLIPQGRVLAVTEGELGEKLFEMSISEDFHHRARPGSRPGSLRRKAGKKEGEKITATDLRRLAARARKMKQSTNADTRQRGIQLARQVSWHRNFHR